MFLFLVVHLLVLPFVLAVTTTTTTTVLHRIYHPLLPPVQFSIRGSLLLSDGSVTFSSAETVAHDLRYFAESLQSLDGALYQIALERKGDPTQGHWSFSSVNACHLPTHTEDHLVLHLTNQGDPFAVDYLVSPVPHNGACPDTNIHPIAFPPFANTSVSVRSQNFPPLPTLVTPPPLTAEGEVIKPEPEKSFFQKYWMYIMIAIFALLLTSGPEEESPRSQQ
jgi:hypothetical protein